MILQFLSLFSQAFNLLIKHTDLLIILTRIILKNIILKNIN